MPYPNEHSCRLEDPGQFDRFARKNCEEKHEGKCIDVIYGVKEGVSKIQALRYNKDTWAEGDARDHCKGRGGSFEPAEEEDAMKAKHEKRGAIPKHSTTTSTEAWDGPANEARLKTDQDYSYYRQAYAWRDPESPPENKGSYKFIHHEVSDDGDPGAANIKACQYSIAILNGARGGADIPDEDRQGVWNHAAAHLKSADVEPAELKSLAELKSIQEDIELRTFDITELRIEEDEKQKPIIRGYASVFNQLSEDIGGFREKVAPGAFKKTIAKDDIRALFNHDPNYVLGRTKNKTLRLAEDEKGLAIEIDPPDTQWARDLMESIRREDITQMSFGFRALKDKWEQIADQLPIRTLIENWLRDISPVTFPAYPQTSVKVRDYLKALSESESEPLDGHSASEEGQDGRLEIEKRRQAFLELLK
jgi:HK97 family phage prohead protease